MPPPPGSSKWRRRMRHFRPISGAIPRCSISPARGRLPRATSCAANDSVSAPDRYAVIGNPVAHSKSPSIHAAFARQTKQHLVYERLHSPLDAFTAIVAQFAREGGNGLNVTAPFKLEAFALCREHSDRALQAGACNTLAWRGTHWFGDNTDGVGLVRDLTVNLGVALAGCDILLLGAGGAARGIVGPLLAAAPRRLVIGNRNPARAGAL